MHLVVAYFATAVTFLILDLLWLGVIARSFYSAQMGDLMAPSAHVGVAAGFYALYIVGVIFFAILPASSGNSPVLGALMNGFALGLLCYGTYDLTNLATTAGWPWVLPFVDIAWGAVLTSVSAAAGALGLVYYSA